MFSGRKWEVKTKLPVSCINFRNWHSYVLAYYSDYQHAVQLGNNLWQLIALKNKK